MPKEGERVLLHYRGTLANGEEFDSTLDGDPVAFTLGEGDVIDGIERAVLQMKAGERRTVEVLPEDGFGDRFEDYVQRVGRSNFKGEEPRVGMTVALQDEEGAYYEAIVREVGGDQVLLDFNHPLAGETLRFELQLVKVG